MNRNTDCDGFEVHLRRNQNHFGFHRDECHEAFRRELFAAPAVCTGYGLHRVRPHVEELLLPVMIAPLERDHRHHSSRRYGQPIHFDSARNYEVFARLFSNALRAIALLQPHQQDWTPFGSGRQYLPTNGSSPTQTFNNRHYPEPYYSRSGEYRGQSQNKTSFGLCYDAGPHSVKSVQPQRNYYAMRDSQSPSALSSPRREPISPQSDLVTPVLEGVSKHVERAKGQVPDGCRAISGPVSREAALEAKKLLHGEWGTETPFTCNGVKYVGRVEEHSPDALRPYSHKGVTLYLDERTRIEDPRTAQSDRVENKHIAGLNGTEAHQGFPVPPPDRDMHTGSEFFAEKLHVSRGADPRNRGLVGIERQAAIAREFANGNVPDFMKPENFRTITLRDNLGNELQVNVMSKPAGIGNNSDYVTAPINMECALAACKTFDLGMPTKKLAEAMYNKADVRLAARGWVGSASDSNYMDGNGFYLRADDAIKNQLKGVKDNALVAGPWKYFTLSKYADPERYPNMSKRLFQFGFWDTTGKPIQQGIFNSGVFDGTENLKHGREHQDYSLVWQGVSQEVVLNGKRTRYDDVLKDPRYAHLLSDEGPFDPKPIYRNTNPALAKIMSAGTAESRIV